MDRHSNCTNNDFYIMQLNNEIIELKIAKEVEDICNLEGLTIESGLKKISRIYSERMRIDGRKENVFQNNN